MENSITEQLKELFDFWIKEHGNDEEYKCEKTGIANDSFTPDGMVNEETWNQLHTENKKKVLYLLREANGNTSTLTEDGKSVDNGEFWFQQCVDNGNIGNIIFKRIEEMQKIIQDEESYNGEILKQVAYMNINKRGGGSTVDWKILNEYAHKYKKQIMKEICILKPDIIVCCGTYWTFIDNICGLYEENDKAKWEPHDKRDFVLEATMEIEDGDKFECLIFNMYHPSARMKTENYIERFKQLWEKYKCNEKEGENIRNMEGRKMIKDYMSIVNNEITIVVCGKNTQLICDKLNGRYANTEEVGAISLSQLSGDSNSDLFILVGDIDQDDTNVLPATARFIDITDKKIAHLLKEQRDINKLREQIIDGIAAPYLGSLIGLDISEIINLIDKSKKIQIGISDSTSALDGRKLINNVIASSGADMSKCNGVYLSICGDIDMIHGNEIANGLQETVGYSTDIVWSMIYNNEAPKSEYYIVTLFME